MKENNPREYVEAVPGPAIVISRETYEAMQQNNTAEQNHQRLERYQEFFDRIQDETKPTTQEEQELTF